MINKNQYLILKELYGKDLVNSTVVSAKLKSSEDYALLVKDGFITEHNPVEICGNILPTQLRIEPSGSIAYEEYQNNEGTKKRERLNTLASIIVAIITIVSFIFSIIAFVRSCGITATTPNTPKIENAVYHAEYSRQTAEY